MLATSQHRPAGCEACHCGRNKRRHGLQQPAVSVRAVVRRPARCTLALVAVVVEQLCPRCDVVLGKDADAVVAFNHDDLGEAVGRQRVVRKLELVALQHKARPSDFDCRDDNRRVAPAQAV